MMETLFRLSSLIIGAFVLGIALWFSLTLFAILFFFGFLIAMFYWMKAYLIEKEILNPTPGVRIGHHEENVTIIEGDYEPAPDDKKD